MAAYRFKTKIEDSQLVALYEDRIHHPVGGKGKRTFDIVFSLLAILSTLPFFILLPIIIFAVSPGPVFFAHTRIGFKGRAFPCLKFRTMVPDADQKLKDYLDTNSEARNEWEKYRKLRDDPRVIPLVGKMMRRLSFDELPQFFNVLRGDMSVVGPRPLTTDELKNYGQASRHYESARPGITGLWQVSGRSDVAFSERIELDCRYVSTCTVATDVGLIAKTIGVLVHGRGAY
ncbi:MAG: sugar transferase [Pseudomonadota bacterium]